MPARVCGLLLLLFFVFSFSIRAEDKVEKAALIGFDELKEFLRLLKDGETSTSERIKLRPIHFAAYRGEAEKASSLVEPQDLQQISRLSTFSPMHAAAAGGNVATIEALLKRNVPAEISTPMGWTPVHIACSRGDLSTLNILLANGGNASMKQEGGLAPLHVAIASRKLECTKRLLKERVDVNSATKTGNTAMHFAVPDLVLMKLLIDNNAVVDVADKDNLKPAYNAVTTGRLDALKLLQEHGATLEPIYVHAAIKMEQKEIFDYLLTQKIDLDAAVVPFVALRPLHFASRSKDPYYARKLLERNVQINAAMENGDTPLHVAAGEGTLEMVNLLLVKGASVTFFNREQETPLFPAAQADRKDVIESILKKGADPLWKRADGATIVDVAEKAGHGELAAYLRSLRQKQ